MTEWQIKQIGLPLVFLNDWGSANIMPLEGKIEGN